MFPLSTLIYCWTAVYGYICLLHLGRYFYRRDSRDLVFTAYAASQTFYALGQAQVISATTIDEAVSSTNLVALSTILGIFCFSAFCERQRAGWSRLSLASLILAVCGLVLYSQGLLFQRPIELVANEWGFEGYDYLNPRISWLGNLYLGLHFSLATAAWYRLFRVKRDRRSAHVFVMGMGVNLLAGFWDILVRQTSLEGPYLLEHLTVLSIVAMSYVLTDEAVETSTQLDKEKQALSTTTASLEEARRFRLTKGYLVTVGRMAAAIAHEVRNPLTAIKNAHLGIANHNASDEQQEVLLSIVESQAERLNKLVQDLRTFAEDQPLNRTRVSPKELIETALSPLQLQRDIHNFRVKLEPQLPDLHCDQFLLSRALTKVFANAATAISNTGELLVSAKPVPRGVQISCIDNGVGMPTEILEQALDPFFSGRAQGVGLGLALARQAVQRHGGTLELHSEVAVGTTVLITLPSVDMEPSP